MKSPLALLLVALVGVTACVDGVTTAPDFRADAATLASNPPPPPVTGTLTGSFSIPVGDDAALRGAMSSLRLDIEASATTLHHTFIQPAIYDKNLTTGISSIQMRNHLAIWVSDAGASVGHGMIQEIDAAGDLWTIDLTQIRSATGGQLLTCESAVEHGAYCVQIGQSINASVQRFHGLDDAGKPVYEPAQHSSASTLQFGWHLTP